MVKSLTEIMAQMTPEMRDRVDARHKELIYAELATLRAENEKLREALAPFADAADKCNEWRLDDCNQAPVAVGDCRKAKDAIA